jgi:alkylation response protein AidB-like acyl-CoA dehydrogenase
MPAVSHQETSFANLPERAKKIGEIANTHAGFADENGRLAEPVVEALHENKMFGMWVPRSVKGGAELNPIASLETIANVAYGDPSAGWVMMAASLAVGTGAAYLEDEAVEELFGGERLPVIAGQGTRPGKAVKHKDGFLLSGSWSFASGLKHGTHIHTLGIIEETGEPRIFVLPVEKAKLIDNWDVMGLRGTGSIDYTIDKAYVPETYTHFAITETPKRGGSLYRIGVIGFAAMCHSGWAIGIGRRLLDEITKSVRERGGLKGPQGGSATFQEAYARTEAKYRAARASVTRPFIVFARPLVVQSCQFIKHRRADAPNGTGVRSLAPLDEEQVVHDCGQTEPRARSIRSLVEDELGLRVGGQRP